MSKERANLLAHKYKRAIKESTRGRYFRELYEMLQPFIFRIGTRYTRDVHNRIDYESVAHEALLKSLDKYEFGRGNFDTYYGNWIRSMVARESISNPTGLRLPDYLAKKDMQITDEDKSIMVQDSDKDYILTKYKLTDSMYVKLCDYYKEVPKYFSDDDATYEQDLDSFELPEIIDSALSELKPSHKAAICRYFGLLGYDKQSAATIKLKYNVDVNDIIKQLKDNQIIKEILEDYYV